MSISHGHAPATEDHAPANADDGRPAARDLIAGLAARPWGQVSPSVYETGRLVALAPWLKGHARRMDFLSATQRADGAWGGPDGYALAPTLSATDAVLSALIRADAGVGTDGDGDRPGLTRVADLGVSALFRLLPRLGMASMPDMPAIELIAASLVASINRSLDVLNDAPSTGLGRWSGGERLRLPRGLSTERFYAVRAMLNAGAAPPDKLLHALETVGEPARGARTVRPAPSGTIGASPAATAAWLDRDGVADPAHPARRFLETVADLDGGPVPCGIPITVFERAWVITNLVRAGIAVEVPAALTASLRGALNPSGTPAGEGLPPDADTTSVALHALGLLGLPYRPDSLWPYRLEGHFCTWQGEDGFSTSTNAHVLEAFGQYAAQHPDATPRHAAVVTELTSLLLGHQRDDGGWLDRWHASPYYATASCALALDRFGGDPARPAVRKAVRWVLATQRADGSWGRWAGTPEETAYALQILLLTHAAGEESHAAVARGHAYLMRSAGGPAGPALWHDKDLYRPDAIVRSAVVAAVHLARRDPSVATLIAAENNDK
ncbi:prenyltransferase/squalene oxidase repeat-containing protein [Actinoallomurus sp. CA-150999]|uniref:prenyltransferase/squalene oxidase repeat-containing protein n=1 Tax=Actinoallomurus sp. CA-150999 TaxID=3239887 RepID=UPI003D90162E